MCAWNLHILAWPCLVALLEIRRRGLAGKHDNKKKKQRKKQTKKNKKQENRSLWSKEHTKDDSIIFGSGGSEMVSQIPSSRYQE